MKDLSPLASLSFDTAFHGPANQPPLAEIIRLIALKRGEARRVGTPIRVWR